MAARLSARSSSVVSVLSFFAMAVLVLSLATIAGGQFAPLSIAAVVGAVGGAIVAAVRSRRGLGPALTSEREPRAAGTIDISRMPVIGIGGLGLVAMSVGVAWALPRVQQAIMWSAAGAVVGAGAFLIWRHSHGGSPFMEHPEETLHLR